MQASDLAKAFDKAFSRMRQHTAAGLDGVAAAFIVNAVIPQPAAKGTSYHMPAHILKHRLSAWFVSMALRGGMPSAWKPVRIQPIFKKGDPMQPANYRPIAITSVLYRVYASMLMTTVDSWAKQHSHIPHEQFGFQHKRSTTQAAFVLRHLTNAQRASASRGRLHCAFVDFEKAYDSVDHNRLWQHLQGTLHMPAAMLRAVQALYAGATYILHDGPKHTRPVPAARGIKQGCPLSPLLFSLYISDLPSELQHCCPTEGIACGASKIRCLLFADDLSLVARSADGLQQLLDALYTYTQRKLLRVNVPKTEVVVFGGRLKARRNQAQVTYGPTKQLLKFSNAFKFLGLQLDESCAMRHTMGARTQPFAAALQRVTSTAVRLKLRRHIPTRLRLATIYAKPTANYGDVVWATAFLQPMHSLNTRLQRQLISYYASVAGVPASTPRWPLLHELGQRPLQRGWWSHIIGFYNSAISAEGSTCSPLMAAALSADMHLAKQQGDSSPTWSGQLLASIRTLESSCHTAAQPSLAAMVTDLQPLSKAAILRLVDAAHGQQCNDQRMGDPRDPATPHRPAATYNAWFRSTAGGVLRYAQRHTSRVKCARVTASIRLRLGAVGVAVNRGRHEKRDYPERCCTACKALTGEHRVDDIAHACFECQPLKERLLAKGCTGPPGNARSFHELFTQPNLSAALVFVEAVSELLTPLVG
jgi:hypothetical protein